MAREDSEKKIVAFQVFEVRHNAVGSFLDVRGYIADHIRASDFFPHWNIQNNVVHFRDAPDRAEKEGAFIGYKNLGYFVTNPPLETFFEQRGAKFWRIFLENKHHKITTIERFGVRTKAFLPSNRSFDDIRNTSSETVFSENIRKAVGGSVDDLQFTLELRDGPFEVRILGGPIKKNEGRKYFDFDDDEFEKSGFLLDVDYFQKGITIADIPALLKKASGHVMDKINTIAALVGV